MGKALSVGAPGELAAPGLILVAAASTTRSGSRIRRRRGIVRHAKIDRAIAQLREHRAVGVPHFLDAEGGGRVVYRGSWFHALHSIIAADAWPATRRLTSSARWIVNACPASAISTKRAPGIAAASSRP